MAEQELKLIMTVRSTERIKIDLLRNKVDGWYIIRWWKLDDNGEDVKVKTIGISPEEWANIREVIGG